MPYTVMCAWCNKQIGFTDIDDKNFDYICCSRQCYKEIKALDKEKIVKSR